MWPFKKSKKSPFDLDQAVEAQEKIIKRTFKGEKLTSITRLALAVDACGRMLEGISARWVGDEPLFSEWLDRPPDDPDRLAVRQEAVSLSLHMVNRIAFSTSGSQESTRLQDQLVPLLIAHVIDPHSTVLVQHRNVRNTVELGEKVMSFVNLVNEAEVEYAHAVDADPIFNDPEVELPSLRNSAMALALLTMFAERITQNMSIAGYENQWSPSGIDIIMFLNFSGQITKYVKVAIRG